VEILNLLLDLFICKEIDRNTDEGRFFFAWGGFKVKRTVGFCEGKNILIVRKMLQ
jgi:hypothetical protein